MTIYSFKENNTDLNAALSSKYEKNIDICIQKYFKNNEEINKVVQELNKRLILKKNLENQRFPDDKAHSAKHGSKPNSIFSLGENSISKYLSNERKKEEILNKLDENHGPGIKKEIEEFSIRYEDLLGRINLTDSEDIEMGIDLKGDNSQRKQIDRKIRHCGKEDQNRLVINNNNNSDFRGQMLRNSDSSHSNGCYQFNDSGVSIETKYHENQLPSSDKESIIDDFNRSKKKIVLDEPNFSGNHDSRRQTWTKSLKGVKSSELQPDIRRELSRSTSQWFNTDPVYRRITDNKMFPVAINSENDDTRFNRQMNFPSARIDNIDDPYNPRDLGIKINRYHADNSYNPRGLRGESDRFRDIIVGMSEMMIDCYHSKLKFPSAHR